MSSPTTCGRFFRLNSAIGVTSLATAATILHRGPETQEKFGAGGPPVLTPGFCSFSQYLVRREYMCAVSRGSRKKGAEALSRPGKNPSGDRALGRGGESATHSRSHLPGALTARERTGRLG